MSAKSNALQPSPTPPRREKRVPCGGRRAATNGSWCRSKHVLSRKKRQKGVCLAAWGRGFLGHHLRFSAEKRERENRGAKRKKQKNVASGKSEFLWGLRKKRLSVGSIFSTTRTSGSHYQPKWRKKEYQRQISTRGGGAGTGNRAAAGKAEAEASRIGWGGGGGGD